MTYDPKKPGGFDLPEPLFFILGSLLAPFYIVKHLITGDFKSAGETFGGLAVFLGGVIAMLIALVAVIVGGIVYLIAIIVKG